jgi:hypothetical protein
MITVGLESLTELAGTQDGVLHMALTSSRPCKKRRKTKDRRANQRRDPCGKSAIGDDHCCSGGGRSVSWTDITATGPPIGQLHRPSSLLHRPLTFSQSRQCKRCLGGGSRGAMRLCHRASSGPPHSSIACGVLGGKIRMHVLWECRSKTGPGLATTTTSTRTRTEAPAVPRGP